MPLSIEVLSAHPVLIQAAIRLFQGESGVAQVTEVAGVPSEVALVHAPGCIDEVRQVFRKLTPLLGLEAREDPSLPSHTARLLLGTADKAPFEGINLDLSVNEATLGDVLERELRELSGAPLGRRKDVPVRRSRVLYGGAGRFCRRAIQLLLLSRGVEVWPRQEWPPDDMDVFVSVCAPEIAALPAVAHNPIEVYCDNPELAEATLQPLRRQGFRLWMLPMAALPRPEAPRLPDAGEAREDRFCAALGPLEREYDEQRGQLLELTREALRAAGVDLELRPLEQVSLRRGPSLVMPLEAFRDGRLRPYGDRFAERYRVLLVGEPCAELRELASRLEGMGFEAVEVVPHVVRRRHGERAPMPQLAPGICWPSPSVPGGLKAQLREALREALEQAGIGPIELEEREENPADQIRIDLPIGPLRELGLEGLTRQLVASLDVRIFAKNRARAQALRAELSARGFGQITIEAPSRVMRPGIAYGRAPLAQMRALGAWMEAQWSIEMPARQVWGSHDGDVHISIPEPASRPEEDAPPSSLATIDLEAWIHGAVAPSTGPFLVREEGWVRVGEQRLKRAMRDEHPRTPSLRAMTHYVLDATTASTVALLASAVRLREPCLLEGETCTSKTSAIVFLAAQLGQPVLRLNLSGQTDTSELVGRYVPGEGASSWRWQDGLVVEAMKRGYWLILDELNLAEAQVLERLNPVLERDPSLTLTEGDGRVLCGDDIHADFRVFATMNPASYAGRAPLSPALRDRFRAYRRVPPPTEQDVLVFLRALVEGEGSPVTVSGRSYPPAPATARSALPGREELLRKALPALARFHASAASAFLEAGAGGRERVTFTRRALLSLLDFLEAGPVSEEALREALFRYYLCRVPPEDLPTMLRLLDASGLGPGTWQPEVPPPSPSQDLLAELFS